MRRVALTVWQSFLILLMVWGLLTALMAAAGRFVPTWNAPGLSSLALIVAAEALITQRLMARERRRLEEQLGARGLELIIIILLVRIWSLGAENDSLLQTIGPWLRNPLDFFGGRFGEYLLWTLGAWVVATMLASDVMCWGEDLVSAPTFDSSIEREQMQQEWGQHVARYDRRYLALVLLTFAATAFALQPSAGTSGSVSGRTMLAGAAISSLVAGLLLHSSGKLSQIRRNWAVDNIEVETGIGRRWSRPMLVLVLLLGLIAPWVSLLVLVAPPPPLVPVANFVLGALTIFVSIVFLILLAPLVLLLSLLRGTAPSVPTQFPFQPPQLPEQTSGERPLIPALIFWGCIVLLIGVALASYLRGRSDLVDALRRRRFIRWLFALFGLAGEWWADARGWTTMALTAVRGLVPRRKRRALPPRPRTAAAQLRMLYRRMKEAGSRRGVQPAPAQTPYEYGSELSRNLPPAQQDIAGLTEAYVVAEYGPRPVGPVELHRARRHWNRLQRWLLRSSTLKRRPKVRRQHDRPDEGKVL
ncbi:MAG TPA: DUF4129 domain-containing protein [Herpetosiphonaceae bacterium]|nr:DUF4129 domain-containing protein [Herpetosiphonaceae bacterium]